MFGRLSYREGPDGVLGVARPSRPASTALELSGVGDPLVLVVAELEKPGNLGTMVRSASAAGAAAVIVADPVTDVFNPNVVRSSQGALFGVPVGVGDTGAVLAWLRRHGLPVYAAGPGAIAALLAAAAGGAVRWSSGPSIGACRRSGSRGRRAGVIPMPGSGGVDSLNAAAAAAVLLFDAVRQRAAAEG